MLERNEKENLILIAAIVLGLVYGWVSAKKNHNPYYPVAGCRGQG